MKIENFLKQYYINWEIGKKELTEFAKKNIHKGYNSWTNLWMFILPTQKKAEEFEHWGWKNVHALYMLGH